MTKRDAQPAGTSPGERQKPRRGRPPKAPAEPGPGASAEERVLAEAKRLKQAALAGDAAAGTELRRLVESTPALAAGVSDFATFAADAVVAAIARVTPRAARRAARAAERRAWTLRCRHPAGLARLLADLAVVTFLLRKLANAALKRSVARGAAAPEDQVRAALATRIDRSVLRGLRAAAAAADETEGAEPAEFQFRFGEPPLAVDGDRVTWGPGPPRAESGCSL